MAVSSGDVASERAERLPKPEPHVLVLFGATGDLARRKLIPGLFHLEQVGLMPDDYRIVGASLEELDDDAFRDHVREALREFCRMEVDDDNWRTFSERLHYVPSKADALAAGVARAEEAIGDEARRLYYLSVPPSAAGPIVRTLGEAGLAERARVVMEKPFGTDLSSARELNETVHEVFAEDQIFRIDHFLGKEAALNMLALRFANGFLEPLWNREHIDHVQIDVPETLAVGSRGEFYEGTGAFRDMIVTHLLQVLAVVAMEPPPSLEPRALVDEKLKVFRSLMPIEPEHVVRGQYEGYRDEKGVAPDSDVETFIAAGVRVDNWRWAGVPFFLRTGKCMAESARVISIAFREPPKSMFPADAGVGGAGPDHLTFDLADTPRLSLSFYGKRPGRGMHLEKASMQFSLGETPQHKDALEAYERLIHDAMTGDRTLFTTAEGVERLWEISAPLLEQPPPLRPYAQGSWGPDEIDDLIAPRHWRLPFERKWRGSG
ncbi:MAG: glucose-6-phosphate 1-dehydrogenase [Solirubrobacteraceae bacterium]|jgi:glucose-6-phosphate 1-dehydrogenase|nr:glucose-6-phosphate 1-dehydrogenase [Solirubrobacteraceae bacterium]